MKLSLLTRQDDLSFENLQAKVSDSSSLFFVLIGPDCDFRHQVFEKFSSTYPNAHVENMGGENACDHEKRHSFIEALRFCGAKTVIGVHVVPAIPRSMPSSTTTDNYERFKDQMWKLCCNPPTPDGLEGLIEVRESDCALSLPDLMEAVKAAMPKIGTDKG